MSPVHRHPERKLGYDRAIEMDGMIALGGTIVSITGEVVVGAVIFSFETVKHIAHTVLR